MKTQKKLQLLVSLLILLIFSLTGCGTASDSGKDTDSSTSALSSESSTDTSTTTSGDSAESADSPTEITVFIAASLSNAMTEIQENYAKVNPDTTIIYNADSSGTLQKQIEAGADCNLFFSAATSQTDTLITEGFMSADTTTNLLGNKVVIIKPTGGETTVTGFDNITNATNLALAGEDVPAGAYARKIFTKLGNLEEVMSMEINECANVSAVLAAVSEGSNEVGVVYQTDAKSAEGKVEVIATATDDMLDSPVSYPLGLVTSEGATNEQTAAAKEFYDYLQTDEAKAIFEKYDFLIN